MKRVPRTHAARALPPSCACAWLILLLLPAVPSAALAAAAPAVDTPPRTLELMVPMRDGVRLATTAYLPAGEGPWPVVLARTPYGRPAAGAGHARYTGEGYAFVVQDQRGRFDSEGAYVPHEAEIQDGYDTVEWVARQSWSTGKVGMTGASALGIAANLAAAAAPPHLEAAWVVVAPQSLFYEGRFVGGMFKEADTGNWMRRQGVSEEEIRAYRRRVVLDQRWLETDFVFRRHAVEIPIYNVAGWYDLFLHGGISNFSYLQQWGRDGARGRQKLLVGPFGHGSLRGDLDYGESRASRSAEELRWFDYWLKGVDNGIMDEPAVTYYQMAAARTGDLSPKAGYRRAPTWPPPASRPMRMYLGANGALSAQPPSAEASSTSYRFDPADPVPTVGGLNLTLPIGPMDQRAVGERPDLLRFATPPLDEDLVLAGKLDMELWAATDGPDTDFVVKLVDVYPDGYEALVLDTGLRTRYRNGRRPEDVAPMIPGEPTLLRIDLWHTALVLERGHRLAVHVTSSNFPRFEVNPNTGEPPGAATRASRVATNTVFHSRRYPSAIVLPVMASLEPRAPSD